MGVRRANPYLAALVAGSVLVAVADVVGFWRGVEPGALAFAWPTIFLVLLMLWVVEDSQAQPRIYKPFEFGLFVLLFIFPYLPYYLWRTRRFTGLLFLVAFLLLYSLGHLAQVAIYAFLVCVEG